MTDLFDIFAKTALPRESPYTKLGFTRNPFRPADPGDAPLPLYPGHIQEEVSRVYTWLKAVQQGHVRQPLSLVGTIGSGKTALLQAVERAIRAWPPDQLAEVFRFNLPDVGMTRPNLGALLVSAIERIGSRFDSGCPDQVLPLIWGIAASTESLPASGRLSAVFDRLRGTTGHQREEVAWLLSRWIERSPLTPAQATRLGLHRRIDWEGEVVPVVAELLRLGSRCGVFTNVFLLVDQLEDLFTANVTALRRARILTDLRGLIDEIDGGAPIGLLLSWSPDFRTGARAAANEIEQKLQSQYEALFSRMERNRVTIPYLTHAHAEPFAETWLAPARAQPGADPSKQPTAADLARAAWASVEGADALFPGGKVTPRELLTHLARIVDHRAGIA